MADAVARLKLAVSLKSADGETRECIMQPHPALKVGRTLTLDMDGRQWEIVRIAGPARDVPSVSAAPVGAFGFKSAPVSIAEYLLMWFRHRMFCPRLQRLDVEKWYCPRCSQKCSGANIDWPSLQRMPKRYTSRKRLGLNFPLTEPPHYWKGA